MVGHRDVPGKPALFGTTKGFLDYFGLKRLDELPPLSELRDIGELEPQLPLDGAPLPVSIASGDAPADEQDDADHGGDETAASNDDGDNEDHQDTASDDTGEDAGEPDDSHPQDDDAAGSDEEGRAPSEQKQ